MDENGCKICSYNQQVLDKLRKEAPDEGTITRLADTFKIFGDNTRIRILWVLFSQELSVSDISDKLGMSQSAISHQLRTLKQARLIKSRRDGKNTFYSLDDDHVKRIIEQVLIHVEEK
ncbi:MAG: helix-turn-helix transcriptional regulator [Oscillospiraceae bacterium]|nr:helix-turn-helix transcriptional regulator [Oscillospiraceae bacterium]